MTKPQLSGENVVAVSDEPHHHLIIDNEVVRAYAVEIAPGERTLCHQHQHDYLLYVSGPGKVHSIADDGEVTQVEYEDGHCESLERGLTHVVENTGDAIFRNIIVELLPGADGPHRAGLPFSSVAGVQAVHLCSDDKICAQLFELRGGSQTQVSGPAVVGSSDGQLFELITPEGGVRKLQHFRDLGYVEPGSTGLLRCEADAPARVLVIAVGAA